MVNCFEYYGGKPIKDDSIFKDMESNDSIINDEEELHIKDYLTANLNGLKTNVILTEMINTPGGEGAVFKTNFKDYVAKIYHKRFRKRYREDKIKLMISHPINDESICWPISLLYYNSDFVGFLMPLVTSDYEAVDYSYGTQDLGDFFKNDRRNILKAMINVSHSFDVLQKNKIVFGDVNFNNILINKNDYSVKLIDIDGAQIDKFPCVTCAEYFNAPELFGNVKDDEYNENNVLNQYHKVYSTYLRDNYSLSAYIYMLLMGNKPFRNILYLSRRDFSFCVESSLNFDENEVYLNRWSHFPHFIKEAFNICFTTMDPNKRPNPRQWEERLQYYLNLLNDESYRSIDKCCLKMYDMDFIDYKKLKKYTYIESFDYVVTSLSLKNSVKKIQKELEKKGIKTTIDVNTISEYLKEKPYINLNNKIKILLKLNIGVLNKVKLEYNV